ncbi:MAG: hypothetical protein ABJN22_07060 [Litorimonas sp.]
MRFFSLGLTSALSVLAVTACQSNESEASTPLVNQSVVDIIADLPRAEVSECLAAAEWIRFYTKSLGQDIAHTTTIKDHWVAAYKQAFSVDAVSPKNVLKDSDFRHDQNGLSGADQLAVRDTRVNACMSYTTKALQESGFEVNMGDRS